MLLFKFQGLEGLRSSFSSVVDDVFQFDKGVPLPQYLPKQKNDLSSTEPSSSSPLGAGDGLPIYATNRQTCVPSLHASPAHKSSIQNSRSYPKSSLTGQPQTVLKSLASGSHVISPVCKSQYIVHYGCRTEGGNMLGWMIIFIYTFCLGKVHPLIDLLFIFQVRHQILELPKVPCLLQFLNMKCAVESVSFQILSTQFRHCNK